MKAQITIQQYLTDLGFNISEFTKLIPITQLKQLIDVELPIAHTAIKLGFTELALYIISRNVDLSGLDQEGNSLLQTACFYNQPIIAKQLIEAGCDLNLVGPFGWTALHITAKFGYKVLASLLIENGADIEIKDYNNQTAFAVAKSEGYSEFSSIFKKNEDESSSQQGSNKNKYNPSSSSTTIDNEESKANEGKKFSPIKLIKLIDIKNYKFNPTNKNFIEKKEIDNLILCTPAINSCAHKTVNISLKNLSISACIALKDYYNIINYNITEQHKIIGRENTCINLMPVKIDNHCLNIAALNHNLTFKHLELLLKPTSAALLAKLSEAGLSRELAQMILSFNRQLAITHSGKESIKNLLAHVLPNSDWVQILLDDNDFITSLMSKNLNYTETLKLAAKTIRNLGIASGSPAEKNKLFNLEADLLMEIVKLDPAYQNKVTHKLAKRKVMMSEPLLKLETESALPLTIRILASRVFVEGNRHCKTDILYRLRELYRNPDLTHILDGIATHMGSNNKKFNIVLLDHDNAGRFSAGSDNSNGYYNNKNSIAVAANRPMHLVMGTLMHELTHSFEQIEHHNSCKPFKVGESTDKLAAASRESMRLIYKRLKMPFDENQTTFALGAAAYKNLYNSAHQFNYEEEAVLKCVLYVYGLYKPDEEFIELVVRYPQLIAQGISTHTLTSLIGPLQDFHRQETIQGTYCTHDIQPSILEIAINNNDSFVFKLLCQRMAQSSLTTLSR